MAEPLVHEQAVELLPWLANGTLEGAEYEAVDTHARLCVICRRELAVLERYAGAAAAVHGERTGPAPDMRRINARIDAQLARRPPLASVAEHLRRWRSNPWRLAFVAQSVAVLALVAVLVPGPREPAYRTLTNAETLVAGHYLRAVFAPALDPGDLGALLAEQGLEIAAGPSDRGVYLLAFAAGVDDGRRDAVLAALQANDQVLFAQAVDADAPR